MKLILARFFLSQFSSILFCRYLKQFAYKRGRSVQTGYDKIFQKFESSDVWKELCSQVFGEYLGQYSFTDTKQIDFLVDKLNITSKSRVLDLACGLGGLSCYLARISGCQIVGLDISSVAVKFANQRAMLEGLKGRAVFRVGILPELPFPSEYFDAIVSIDSIYGIPDKGQLFRECFRVLKPGGRIGFYTLYKRGDFSLIAALNSRALYWFPLKSYNALLWQTGFRRILKIDMTAEFVQLARIWIRAISLKKRLLEKELGKDVTNGLLKGDILVALKLAEAGLIGRAFFYGEKPVTGLW